MEQFEGSVSVVTGGGSGIGRSIALALGRAGSSVLVADIDQGRAETVAAELAAIGVDSTGVPCDVTDRDAVEDLAALAWDRHGHVDVIANNAGVFPPMARTLNIEESDARWVLEVNLMGVWYGCVAFGRRFVEQGTPAHILNTGSENSLGIAHTHAAFYTASKHAVFGLSDVLRRELPEFVGVSVLCPGMVRTDLGGSVRNRQARFGGPATVSALSDRGMDPDEVGERAVEGMVRGDFLIVTHPPVRELVEERMSEILAAFDAQAPRFPGDSTLDTRAVMGASARPKS
jgi:NAD(P)-dependent dehydrogenase (short-subunit alcohol dehydrogenase family)